MSLAQWTPSQEGVQRLIALLQASTSGDNQRTRAVQGELEQMSQSHEYGCYLAFVFACIPDLGVSTRAVAGLALKNLIRQRASSLDEGIIGVIKDAALQGATDPNEMIRSTAGNVITTMIAEVGLARWLTILERLVQLTQQSDPRVVETSFRTIAKVCEDNSGQLVDHPSDPLRTLVPYFIECMGQSSSAAVRADVIRSLTQFLPRTDCKAMHDNMPTFLAGLYERALDDSSDVRCAVCFAMSRIFEYSPRFLIDQLSNVVDFMLFCMQGDAQAVRLEACEFWLCFSENPEMHDMLRPYLGRVVPVLLSCMVYSDDDLLMFGTLEENDAAVPDRDQEIKPRHHKAKTHAAGHEDGAPAKKAGSSGNVGSNVSLDEARAGSDDDEDDDDDDDDDELDSEWSVRKCSAATLDVMSNVFNDELLPVLLPELQKFLGSTDWLHREAAILALGAIAEGCETGMVQHLPALLPLLFAALRDGKLLIRVIASWTLSRYAAWCVRPEGLEDAALAAHQQTYLSPLVAQMLQTMLDNNKRVQEAACSAFSTVEEIAEEALAPYLEAVVGTFAIALTRFQHKNLLILYDAIGTLAESVGTAFTEPKVVQSLLPRLLERWNQLADDDRDLFPLLECLSSIAVALGPAFAPYAPALWDRCVRVVQTCLDQAARHVSAPAHVDAPDMDFVVSALDLMSGITQGLGKNVEPLVAASHTLVLPLLQVTLQASVADVRQSAFALLGDLAIAAYPFLRPSVTELLQLCIAHTEADVPMHLLSVINNAIWAAGEIALQDAAAVEPLAAPIIAKVVPILCNGHGNSMLFENCAITLGRLGLACPQQLVGAIPEFIEPWCRTLQYVADNHEKITAFQGLCNILMASPQAISAAQVAVFVEAMAHFRKPTQQLATSFHGLLTGYRQMYAAQWASLFHSSSDSVRQLFATFQIPLE